MHTLRDRSRKRKRGISRPSEDLRLLQLLLSRRRRLEGEMTGDWNRSHSLEIDLVVAMEEAVLNGWARRLGMQ
jgi:hypothetical protein